VAKEQVAGEKAAAIEREYIEAVLNSVVRFLNERGGPANAGQVSSDFTVADIRDELQRFQSKHPEAAAAEVRHYLTAWAIQQLQVSPLVARSYDRLTANVETNLKLHAQRLRDAKVIEEHFNLEDNVEAELMAVRIVAFFVDALKKGQKILLRDKDGTESEVIFESDSDSDSDSDSGEQEPPAHG
jgi:hypothetical protein